MKDRWNPYMAGALTGVLLVLSVAVAGKYFGASTTFARGAAVIEEAVGVDTRQFDYFTTKDGKYGPFSLPDWQLLFVVGIALGGLAASLASGTFEIKRVPDMWAARFGERPLWRNLTAFAGGIVLIVGARLAGGCPSGHGLSGLSQLALSGFVALAFFFAGGWLTANLLYSKRGGGS
jgi:uncharacterized membrane protein YedE/YeeE